VISVVVVTLVVWLVLVFLSVTAGIEKTWISKLTSLYAPLRICPTDDYYRSYFYQIDAYASASNHTLKTIGEKAQSLASDPYVVMDDMELPQRLSKSELDGEGSLIDPVKLAFRALGETKHTFADLTYQDYEISGALLKLELLREGRISYLSQMSYLLSFQQENPFFSTLLLDAPHALSDNEVLLPKSYQANGVQVGDHGVLSYSATTSAVSQEQRIPIRVVGFYDPGLLSIGNRSLIVPSHITRQIYSSSQTFCPDGSPTNGIFVWPKNIKEVPKIAERLQKRFQQMGIDKYWKITSFEEYEFSKDLLQQFRSDRLLFSLIGAIILFVACCNIISLLILLVNDKKREIAILQSMGATRKSIVCIFAICGTAMGVLSCLLGTTAALFTLRNLDTLLVFLSKIQGKTPLIFHQTLSKELSAEALFFTLLATPILSLFAALLPALKASRIRASTVLRSE